MLVVLALFFVATVSADDPPKKSPPKEQFVTITGDIRAPGRIAWTPDLTLLDAIAAAGGPSGTPIIFIVRGSDRIPVSFRAIRKGRASNPKLQPGDRIEIESGAF